VGYGILSFPSSTGSATNVVSSNGGAVTLKADTMNLVGNLGGTTTISSNAVGGSIAVKQNTATRPIDMGLAVDTITTLGISTAEFARLNAPIITMGDSNSGTINVSAIIAPATSVATLALANNTTFAATGGFTGCAVTGDLVLGMARNGGAIGFVTDGCVRDLPGIAAVGIPAFCVGVTPNSPARSGPGTVGFPVVLAGMRIASGDVLLADGDGVVVIPQERIEEVLAKLPAIRSAEADMERRVAAGMRTPPFLDPA
jgi:hypothetical protein